VFDESQVLRIDHFLGKETMQSLLALRFGNGGYESVWNRGHIAHVQIDVPEAPSVGSRAGLYEQTGAFRDMVVTHLFQVLGFVAMEPPTSFSPRALLDETVKVFQAMAPLRPQDMVRGQYGYRDDACGGAAELEAYERLIHDALMGDRTLFTCADAIERLWEIAAPVLADRPPRVPYEPGSWGPAAIAEFIAPDRWHLPEPG
jgi:glucose-6-phosphate 1-dehydrogenase